MNKIEQLIKNICPNGVNFRSLGEVCSVNKGKQLNKELLTSVGKYPAYNGGVTYSGFTDNYNNLENRTIICQGGSAGFVNYITTKFWANAHCYVLVPNEKKINKRYLYHLVKRNENNFMQSKYGAGIPALKISEITNFIIPIPPLEIQCEIVKILDNFTELTAELTAELATRQKQYEFYRNKLLAYDRIVNSGMVVDVRWLSLSEIATDMYRGVGIKRDEITKMGMPCVRYGEIYTTYKIWFDKCISYTQAGVKYFEHGDILFAITGESIDEIAKSCAYVGYERCLAGGDIVVMKHNENPKYIAYALSTDNAQEQKSKGKIKNKVVHISIPELKRIIIPVPLPQEQERIVDILDKFAELTVDISKGLPGEIKARQQQYEYYRDKLLTFKEFKK